MDQFPSEISSQEISTLKMMVEQMPAILWTTDAELRFTMSIGSGLAGLGLDPNQVKGMNLFEFFGTDNREFLPIASHYMALDGAASTYEVEWSGRAFHCHVEPLKNSAGKINGVIGVALDISDRKKIEDFNRMRADSSARFRMVLLELAKTPGIDIGDSLKKIVELDAKTLNCERVSIWYFDQNRTEIECQTLYELTKDSYQKGVLLKAEDYPNYFIALEESRIIAAHDARKDPRTLEFTKSYLEPLGICSMLDVPIRSQGEVRGIICHEHVGPKREWTNEEQEFAASIADMVSLSLETWERKRAEKALQRTSKDLARSNKELEQFAYVASHDLQEPLHKVIGFSDRLLELYSESLDERGQDYLSRIQRAASGMRSLIEELLAFARISTQVGSFEKVDLNLLLKEVKNSLEFRLEETKGSLEIKMLPKISGDHIQITQLFQNLISNSLKFFRKDCPPLVIIDSLIDEKGGPIIRVRDNGIGIEEKYFKEIFKPFSRLNPRSRYDGSGMGLALCEKIIHRHGGEILIESKIGKGSNFLIKFHAEPAGTPKE